MIATGPQSIDTLKESREDALPAGAPLLHGQYRVERYLNAGGFGITYLAFDSLDRRVVIKECFPNAICCRSEQSVRARSRSLDTEFEAVVRQFGQEARRLAKLRHPNIVGVHQVFEDNGTAYMAMDYVEGRDLLHIVETSRDELSPEIIKEMLLKLLDAIVFIHERDVLHRDISPDNILVDAAWNPVLIDFGAAREVATNASRTLSALHVVKDGYSPQEFYLANNSQSQSSDLYSLAATFYHLIGGVAPPNSQLRLAALAAEELDPYKPVPPRTEGYDRFFLGALDSALAVFPKDRIESAVAWIEEIHQERREKALLERARKDQEIELAIRQLAEETNRDIAAEEQDAKPDADTEAVVVEDDPVPPEVTVEPTAGAVDALAEEEETVCAETADDGLDEIPDAVPSAADRLQDGIIEPIQDDVIPPPQRRSLFFRIMSRPITHLFSRRSTEQDPIRRP